MGFSFEEESMDPRGEAIWSGKAILDYIEDTQNLEILCPNGPVSASRVGGSLFADFTISEVSCVMSHGGSQRGFG